MIPCPIHIKFKYSVIKKDRLNFKWDAHEAQLRCPDGVSGDIGGCSASRDLKPKFY